MSTLQIKRDLPSRWIDRGRLIPRPALGVELPLNLDLSFIVAKTSNRFKRRYLERGLFLGGCDAQSNICRRRFNLSAWDDRLWFGD